MQTHSGFHGVYPMLLAFYDQSGGLDPLGLKRQVDVAIACGCEGIAILGLGTDVNKLSLAERRTVIEVVSSHLNRRLPLSVTVAENTPGGQTEFAKFAVEHGADWIILQPPPAVEVDEQELIRFFGATIDRLSVPVGIQNAPMYLQIGLSNAGLTELHRRHPQLKIVKVEDDPLLIARLIQETQGEIDVFVGRDGMEMIDLLKAGAAGLIPGFESCDRIARSYQAFRTDDLTTAWKEYREVESGIVFLERSINHYVTYAREIAARRLGIEPIVHRLPKPLSPLGIEIAARTAEELGRL